MRNLFLTFIVLVPWYSMARNNDKNNSQKFIALSTAEAGVNINTNGAMSALALHAEQYWGFGNKKKNFKIGLGARLTSTVGNSSIEYITAPAILTSGKTGPGVFFTNNINNNIDTVTLNRTQVNSLNAFLLLNYHLFKRWSIEFNIDLIGFSFGGKKEAALKYGEGGSLVKNTQAKPTSGNALLISDNDIGSLNSELKVFYAVKKKIKLNAGLAFLFNEYKLTAPVQYVNTIGTNVNTDRYRTKALMLNVGFNYVLNKK